MIYFSGDSDSNSDGDSDIDGDWWWQWQRLTRGSCYLVWCEVCWSPQGWCSQGPAAHQDES